MQQKSPHAVIDNKLLKLFVCLCNQKPADSKYLMYRIEGILSLSIYVPYVTCACGRVSSVATYGAVLQFFACLTVTVVVKLPLDLLAR